MKKKELNKAERQTLDSTKAKYKTEITNSYFFTAHFTGINQLRHPWV